MSEPGPDIEPLRARLRPLMLKELERAHRVRALRRNLGAAAAIALVGTAAFSVATHRPQRASIPHVIEVAESALPSSIVLVHTDEARARAAARRTSEMTPRYTVIDDGTLCSLLSAQGIQTGVARSAGRTWLTAQIDKVMHQPPG